MSPLWHDQLRIVLSPRQVALVRRARGWSPRIADKHIVSCNAAKPGDAPWRNALAALETALPDFGTYKADAIVILSNHFARYTLVLRSDQISTANEEQALARHSFARIYGDSSDRWALRLSDAEGDFRVACAVDQGLPDSLRALFQPTRLRLRSIQPYFMTAFNQWRHHIKDAAWFALVEQGRLCLASFRDRRWRSLKALKIGDDWFGELVAQLEREDFLAGSAAGDTAATVPVLVLAPGCPEPTREQAETRGIQLLRSMLPLDAAETAEPVYAMALTG